MVADPWDSPPLVLNQKVEAGPAIAYRILPAQGPAKVAVLMSTGYFENMKRYRYVIDRWTAHGMLVAIYDLRGHGLSEGARGFVAHFDDYVGDVLALLTELGREPAWKALEPPILFGHSLGGLISIHVALQAPKRISALVLSSPYLALAKEAPPIKIAAAHLLSRFLPKISLEANVNGSECTHSLEIAASYDRDPLNFRKANVRWFTETVAAQKRALERAHLMHVPIYCLHAGDDVIALPAATDRFMQDVGSTDRHYEHLTGLYHEILNEPDRATWIEKYATAMLAYAPSAAAPRTET